MMWEKVIGDIDKLRHIVEQWQNSGEVHDIEKDVALDKIRTIYEQVKFASPQKAEPQQEACTLSVPVREEAKVEAPPAAEAQSEGANIYEAPLKPRPDRKKLMSLYGDGGHFAPVVEPEKSVEEPVAAEVGEVAGVVEELDLFVTEVTETDPQLGEDILKAFGFAEEAAPENKVQAEEVPLAKTAGDTTKKVFADTVKAGETFADVYARNNKQEDVADRLKNSSVSSVRLALGINDRFLLVRDLFGGDSEACDRTIRELDALADLDDAMLYIYDNFTWNPESDGAKLLVDLLTRKLS